MTQARVVSSAEVRYRRLLRAYPLDWRERHGDALLGVLLDTAEAERRAAPTLREVIDLTARGLHARALSAGNADVRRTVASISAGLGVGFAPLYFLLFSGPAVWGTSLPLTHIGPAAVLLVWALVLVAVVLRLHVVWRASLLIVAALVPCALLVAPGLIVADSTRVVSAWAGPSSANAGFLVSLAVLSAVGPVDRRILLRTAAIAGLAFAAVFWVTGAWHNPYVRTMWGSPNRSAFAAPGTLQELWGSGSGRMPLVHDEGPRPGDLVREWAQSSVLRLNIVTVAAVAAAVGTAVGLLLRGRTVQGRAVMVLACPFVIGLVLCASHPTGVWFQ